MWEETLSKKQVFHWCQNFMHGQKLVACKTLSNHRDQQTPCFRVLTVFYTWVFWRLFQLLSQKLSPHFNGKDRSYKSEMCRPHSRPRKHWINCTEKNFPQTIYNPDCNFHYLGPLKETLNGNNKFGDMEVKMFLRSLLPLWKKHL